MTNSDLQQLSKDFFQNSLDSSPTSAIMRGHKQYFDQIEELNEETFEKETKAVNDFISRPVSYTHLTLPTNGTV